MPGHHVVLAFGGGDSRGRGAEGEKEAVSLAELAAGLDQVMDEGRLGPSLGQPIHDRVVCELIGRAVVLCPDDIRHNREGYAVTVAAREVVNATKEDQAEALEALRRLRR